MDGSQMRCNYNLTGDNDQTKCIDGRPDFIKIRIVFIHDDWPGPQLLDYTIPYKFGLP